MNVLHTWVPRVVGVGGALIFLGWAAAGDMPIPPALTAALLTGAGLWATARMAARLLREGRKGTVSIIALGAACVVPLLTGFVIKTQSPGRDVTVWATIFFLSGITVGLAAGAHGTYHQMK